MEMIIFSLVLIGGVIALFYFDHRARKRMHSH